MFRLTSVLLLSLGFCKAQSRTVALTFDDLPIAAGGDAVEARKVNDAILSVLAKHQAVATAFVNDQTVQRIGTSEGRGIMRRWVDQGNELGNHTFSHPDLNEITVEQFKDEVIRGEASIVQLSAGKRPQYLRFPFNHTGDTKEKHDAVAMFLHDRGYTVATCTIDNSDYEYARAYNLMLQRDDREAAKKLRVEYLTFTAAEIDYYTNLNKTVFGREIPHVMLLHANRLNADVLDQILTLFVERRFTFVTLSQAQSDEAYRTPDAFLSKFGPMWGYRWAKELGVQVNGRLEPEPAEWVLKYGS